MSELPDFHKLVPYLRHPLVLVGFVLQLVFILLLTLLKLDVFPALTQGDGGRLLMIIVIGGFGLAVIAMIGGFGLAAYRLKVDGSRPRAATPSTLAPAPVGVPALLPPLQSVPVPTGAPGSARVTRIVEGRGSSAQQRLFDVTIENPAGPHLTLDTLRVQWRYHHGYAASVQRAVTVEPTTTHAVVLTVDPTSADRHIQNLPVVPTVVIPAGTPRTPSLHVLRLEVLYRIAGSNGAHPASDWNIVFGITITTTSGTDIPVFVDARWRN